MEHYGITVPSVSARIITETHAGRVKAQEALLSVIPERDGEEYIIAGTDGSMIPIADTEAVGKESDRRKNRKCGWKEARLTLSHPKGPVSSVFGGTPGSPDGTGDYLLNCAIRSGMGQKTEVHCAGDGAPRIADQIDRVSGEQGSFLIDFYHLCDYLSDASEVCSVPDFKAFFNGQKQLAGEGRMRELLIRMKPYTEPVSVPDRNASVRRCIRYITNRPGQFNYKEAAENDLPVGSGEIERSSLGILFGNA
jgi:hypothetical protein